MGVEHYVVCDDCKEYIDIHKCRSFVGFMIPSHRPPHIDDYDLFLKGGYWESRAVWFLTKHLKHDVRLSSDHSDSWFSEEPYLKEVWPYREDTRKTNDKT